ncbi:UbiA prenyltransferase family-domain-containing protein [Pyrenochaeta sp. MPI-SDFR-AT-0127]|nr:UbiA prenyltransferase family-domain-containing protein [Pyrenochaeta sp. MPI-SDFR-AT-0127]
MVSLGIFYHVYTLFLFTSDQILDAVIPGTAFATFATLSGPVLDLPSQNATAIIQRIPLVSFWLWLVVFQACLHNQRRRESVREDALNKPWRPLPSGRITRGQTDNLLFVTYILLGFLSHYLEVLSIFILYTMLIVGYNDLGGGDYSGFVRNLFCAAGFSCYFSGAFSIALGTDIFMSYHAWNWTLLITFGTLATTFQTQEFRDEVGDRARGRCTLVTELGRKHALWTVMVAVTFWSLYTPFVFFECGWRGATLPIALGWALVVTAIQAIGEESQKFDRKMYKIWCLWMITFCPLPIFGNGSA